MNDSETPIAAASSGHPTQTVLNLWTNPRSLSTALTLSFAQRPDTKIFDEPIMNHYLRVTGKDYLDSETVEMSHDADGETCMQKVFTFEKKAEEVEAGSSEEKNVHWVKNMPHNWVQMDNAKWFPKMQHLFLLRKTEDMIRSYTKLRPDFKPEDLGYKAMWEMYVDLTENYGFSPLIIRTEDLQNEPEVVLKAVCKKHGIPFYEQMLSWKEGGHQDLMKLENSWYGSVTKSTGFTPYKPNSTPIDDKFLPAFEENRKYYDLLNDKAPSLEDLRSGNGFQDRRASICFVPLQKKGMKGKIYPIAFSLTKLPLNS